MKAVWKKESFREALAGYSFMIPTILVIGTFVVLPIIYALFIAFHKVRILGALNYRFIGLKSFFRMVDDERVWIALKNTAEYVSVVVPIQTILALGLALILNSQIKGKNLFRIIFFLPTVTSSAVLTLIFMWIYNSNGLFNNILAFLGLPTYNWIGDPMVALKSIMLIIFGQQHLFIW
jgi:multiple sugar transport system permease protein